MTKIKIAYVAENAVGGVVYYILGQIRLLDPAKYTFKVFFWNLSWRNVSSATKIFKDAGIECIEMDLSHDMNKFKVMYDFADKYLRGSDIIVATTKYELTGYCLAKLNTNIILYSLADSEIELEDVFEFGDILDKIVPNSEIFTQKVKKLIPKKNLDKVVYLQQAIPLGTCKYLQHTRSDKFVITFVGRFNGYKGADYLIEIGNKIKVTASEIRFNIVSNGVNEDEFRSQWACNATTSFYRNIPNSELEKIWLASDIVIMPSRNEGMPVALIEAMRLGVVPICSDLANGIRELVVPGKTGFLVEVGDIDGFVEAIITLYKDSLKYDCLSKGALELVKEKFDPNVCIKRFDNLFASLKQKKFINYPRKYSSLGKLDRQFIPHIVVRIFRRLVRMQP